MPISAQEYGIQASIGPDLIAHAKTGDAYANYVIAYKYFLLDVANDRNWIGTDFGDMPSLISMSKYP